MAEVQKEVNKNRQFFSQKHFSARNANGFARKSLQLRDSSKAQKNVQEIKAIKFIE